MAVYYDDDDDDDGEDGGGVSHLRNPQKLIWNNTSQMDVAPYTRSGNFIKY